MGITGLVSPLHGESRLDLIGDRFIGRRLVLYAIVLVLSIAFIQPALAKQQEPQQLNKSEAPVQQAKAEAPKPETTVDPVVTETQAPPQPVAETVAANPPTPVSAGSCEEAIANVWPAALQSGARLVSTKESSMISDRIGPLKADGTVGFNYDGSRDYGCFQINDKAHPAFFANGDWRDPTYNAQYALQLYNERGNWTAWYAVRGILW